ncbi:MAG: hypothetical protein J5I92_15350 [Thiogranum sp.]|nr:hypothetical protein [Thiogranum sp.]
MTDDETEAQKQQRETFESQFRPTAERLRKLADRGAELLEAATDEDLGSWSE